MKIVNIYLLLSHNSVGSLCSSLLPEPTLFLKPIRAPGSNRVLKKATPAIGIHA